MSREIALITPNDLQTMGGSEESTKNLLTYRKPGIDGWVVVSPHQIPSDVPVANSYVTREMFELPLTHQRLPTVSEIKRVRSFLEDIDPQAIILNHPLFYSPSIFFALPQELKERTYALWRGIVGDIPDNGLAQSAIAKQIRKFKWHGQELVQKKVGNAVKMNLAVSQAAADSLINMGINKHKVAVIPEQIGGEYTAELRNSPDHQKLRGEFLEPNELGVLVVSRISPEKGIDWVLDLYERLKYELGYQNNSGNKEDIFRRVRLSIAGSAAEERQEYLEQLFERKKRIEDNTLGFDNVQLNFIGRKNREELQKLYNAYDILFMPSPTEGFGRVTVEALSAGMPVIGRKGCAATEAILHASPNTVGTLAESPTNAASEVLRLMKNPQKLKKLQSNAAQWAGSYYTKEKAQEGFWEAIGK